MGRIVQAGRERTLKRDMVVGVRAFFGEGALSASLWGLPGESKLAEPS